MSDILSEDDISAAALAWLGDGARIALGTVLSTWGSAPRPTGSQIVIRDDGQFLGSVSGGCVEGAVIHAGLDAMQSGKSEILEFGVSNSEAWEVGLACGGRIQILVSPVDEARAKLLQDLQDAKSAKTPVVEVTDLESFSSSLIEVSRSESQTALTDAAATVLRTDRAGVTEIGEGRYFLNPVNPPLRLFIVGAVHIAQSLAAMAREVGYDVTLIDPREAFASPERFPDYTISHDWPDEALGKVGLDARSAVVTLTHDPKIDDPALTAALGSTAFYIGSLGSTKTHGARLTRLERAGFKEGDLARIHGPVGLNIGSRSPSEIAVSILAEMTQVLRQATQATAKATQAAAQGEKAHP